MQREKEDTKPTKPDEACCYDPAPEQAPVTVEMIQEAYDRLEELVNQCKTPVLLCMLAEKKESKITHRVSTNDSVSKMTVKDGMVWIAASGFLHASTTCFSGAPEAISQGIKYVFEDIERRKRRDIFAGIIDTPFEH